MLVFRLHGKKKFRVKVFEVSFGETARTCITCIFINHVFGVTCVLSIGVCVIGLCYVCRLVIVLVCSPSDAVAMSYSGCRRNVCKYRSNVNMVNYYVSRTLKFGKLINMFQEPLSLLIYYDSKALKFLFLLILVLCISYMCVGFLMNEERKEKGRDRPPN